MEFANGTVKKYSREYTRTLKNGKKKKYKTEQVQVTVPKAENIFEDTEEVILIRKSDFVEVEDVDEMIIALELFNSILTEKIQNLESELIKNNEVIDDFKDKISDSVSKEDLSQLQNELETKNSLINDLNSQIDLFKEELESKKLIISDLEEGLISKNSSSTSNELDSSFNSDSEELGFNLSNNLDNSYSNVNDNNKEYIELQKEFIRLSKKFESVQEELFNVKVNALYYKNLANKYKKFILKLE